MQFCKWASTWLYHFRHFRGIITEWVWDKASTWNCFIFGDTESP